ncbi:unnamed protein product [Dovyalis caffra]|uniref:Uncharacterized protein n=1 Tax=Dovyalis caffra TaxID=77055 RepID=A0AAV1RCW9_9ROSI|nr:unnamed protein product [Dovyalis caffra]
MPVISTLFVFLVPSTTTSTDHAVSPCNLNRDEQIISVTERGSVVIEVESEEKWRGKGEDGEGA